MPDNAEAGFTFVELIVALAIIAVLAGLSLTSFHLYRERGYYVISEQMLPNSRSALEAGKINSEEFPGIMWLWQDTPGPPNTAVGQQLLPGLIVPQDFQIYVSHNPTCAAGWCLEDYIRLRHCRTQRYLYWYRFHNGIEFHSGPVETPLSC